jgi:FixJ family two-component response regulator
MGGDTPAIVVIDDDASIRKSLDNLFRSVGFQAELFASPQEFLQSNRPDRPGCIVLDVRFPGRSGLDIQVGIGADLVQACGEPIVVVLIASAAGCLVVCKASGRAGVKALFRATAPSGAG